MNDEYLKLRNFYENYALKSLYAGLIDIENEEDFNKVVDTFIKIHLENEEKNKISDTYIDYNDEIVSIEPVGIKETIDISVTGDSLFYCNDILTKNSFGIVFTGDFIYSLSSTDEQKESGTIMIKQLKNRYTDMSMNTRFLMGIDRQKMRMFDLDDPTNLDQKDLPVMDKTEFGQKSNKSFDDFVF